jgi:hypothetical protein
MKTVASTLALTLATGRALAAPNSNAPPALKPIPAPAKFVLPDLQPIPSRLVSHGVVSIKNAGAGASAAAFVTIDCSKNNQPQGGCPDINDPAYENPAFPNRVTVAIPAIAPGHVYSVKLAFWDALVWPSGSYTLKMIADAGNTVAEANEANNVGSGVKTVP